MPCQPAWRVGPLHVRGRRVRLVFAWCSAALSDETQNQSEIPAKRKADARIRTADPFITSHGRSGLSRPKMAQVYEQQGNVRQLETALGRVVLDANLTRSSPSCGRSTEKEAEDENDSGTPSGPVLKWLAMLTHQTASSVMCRGSHRPRPAGAARVSEGEVSLMRGSARCRPLRLLPPCDLRRCSAYSGELRCCFLPGIYPCDLARGTVSGDAIAGLSAGSSSAEGKACRVDHLGVVSLARSIRVRALIACPAIRSASQIAATAGATCWVPSAVRCWYVTVLRNFPTQSPPV